MFDMIDLQLYVVHMGYDWEVSRAFRDNDKVYYIDQYIAGNVAWDYYTDFLKFVNKAEVM